MLGDVVGENDIEFTAVVIHPNCLIIEKVVVGQTKVVVKNYAEIVTVLLLR